MKNPITEEDLRLPQFRGVPIDELERREDGEIVRRDRWERGIREIAGILDMSPRGGFEIDEVVQRVRDLSESSPAEDGRPRLVVATIDTRNFAFMVVARTTSEAEALLRKAWPIHCQQTGARVDMVGELVESLRCVSVAVGDVLRDGEPLFSDVPAAQGGQE